MSEIKEYTTQGKYKQNLDNIKAYLNQDMPDIQGSKDSKDPTIEEWEAITNMFTGALILLRTGLELKRKMIEEGK